MQKVESHIFYDFLFSNIDIGKVIIEDNFVWRCERNDVNTFAHYMEENTNVYANVSEWDFQYLRDYYSDDMEYGTITSSITSI